MRLWWEETYAQPSLANPLFEAVPLADHAAHLLARHLRGGGGVEVTAAGSWRMVKAAVADTSTAPHFTGDVASDTMERRIALGAPTDDDEEPPRAHAS